MLPQSYLSSDIIASFSTHVQGLLTSNELINMGQGSSTPAPTYDSNSELQGHDAETSRAIAEAALHDIDDISALRKGQVGAQAPLSDEEYALILQRELYEDTIQTVDDNATAKRLKHTIDRGSRRAGALVDKGVQDDRRGALLSALLNTEQLPPRSEAQRFMGHPILRKVMNPPSKNGRYGSPKTNSPSSPAPEDNNQPQNALPVSEAFQDIIRGMQPRYMRSSSETLVEWSKTAQPLPDPPKAELKNSVVLKTVARNPSLFKIVTPIKVDLFEELLVGHPNQAFVQSVCKGLREGFWPFADTYIGKYPDTHDGSLKMPRDPAEAGFLRKQRDIEIEKGRFSESFGTRLLPGMYSSPIHVVPKRGTPDFRLVTNHSGGKYPLNSMISYDDIAGMPLDDMRHLKEKLLAAHATGRKLTLWKSDVTEAYRLCPMHPHWQIKQVNTIDGERYIDRNNTFGNRASFKIWGSVNSLIMWLAQCVWEIKHPLCYNDDTYGVCDAKETQFYKPYNRSMPRDQCKLLELWDLLGIPHKEKKQISGNPLTIIGIEVDANKMTMTLPADRKTALAGELERLIARPNGKALSFSLKEFQRFAGGMNAALNVFPLLRPALTNIYAKIGEIDRNSEKSNTEIVCDPAIRDDLTWALKHIQNSKGTTGISILDARAWKPEEADITVYTSSNLKSLAFWYPDLKPSIAYYFDTHNVPSNLEHFLKALCVASAFLDAASRGKRSSLKIVIYTDNSSPVNMFDSFHCTPLYNNLLKAVADSMIKHKHKLKVLQKKNPIVNLLAQGSFSEARKRVPGLEITPFKPSDKLLGPLKNRSSLSN